MHVQVACVDRRFHLDKPCLATGLMHVTNVQRASWTFKTWQTNCRPTECFLHNIISMPCHQEFSDCQQRQNGHLTVPDDTTTGNDIGIIHEAATRMTMTLPHIHVAVADLSRRQRYVACYADRRSEPLACMVVYGIWRPLKPHRQRRRRNYQRRDTLGSILCTCTDILHCAVLRSRHCTTTASTRMVQSGFLLASPSDLHGSSVSSVALARRPARRCCCCLLSKLVALVSYRSLVWVYSCRSWQTPSSRRASDASCRLRSLRPRIGS